MLEDRKILITGANGRIAFPIARALASGNEVWGVARFTDPASQSRLESVGVRPVAMDVSTADLSSLPDDFTHVFHAAMATGGEGWGSAFETNSQAPGRVLYIGSASKRLAPGMRLGWMLPPSWMSWALISAKAIEDAGSEVAGQLALADFIARGELERHLRRMRQRYRQRGERLAAALAAHFPDWQASLTGGLHATVLLPDRTDEHALLAAAARHGVGLEGLSLHSYAGDYPPGLLMGHAYLSEPAIRRGVQLLAEALRS